MLGRGLELIGEYGEKIPWNFLSRKPESWARGAFIIFNKTCTIKQLHYGPVFKVKDELAPEEGCSLESRGNAFVIALFIVIGTISLLIIPLYCYYLGYALLKKRIHIKGAFRFANRQMQYPSDKGKKDLELQ